jgi:hypothetical protein
MLSNSRLAALQRHAHADTTQHSQVDAARLRLQGLRTAFLATMVTALAVSESLESDPLLRPAAIEEGQLVRVRPSLVSMTSTAQSAPTQPHLVDSGGVVRLVTHKETEPAAH